MVDKLRMARPLSEDLRKRIVKKREEGYSEADVSQIFGISTSSVYRFFRRQRESGDLRPKKMGQPEGSKLNPHKDLIQGWIKEEPGATLEELTVRLADELDIHVHHTTVMRALSRWGYSYKKKLYTRGSKTALTSRKSAHSGKSSSSVGIPAGSSSSTSAGSTRR